MSSSSSLSAAAPAPARAGSHGSSPSGSDNPLVRPAGISALARPGGRQSVSGIVATVFGGSGMLGRYVVNHLGRIGSQVVTPYRSADGMNVRHLKLAGDLGQIVPIPCDISDVESVARCMARSNVVINCIGQRHETVHYSFDDVHAKVPYRLAQMAKIMGVERFIQVSAVGADVNSESRYFQSKAEGELAVKEFYPDATIIRPTVMFGPQDDFLSYYAYLGGKLAAVPMSNEGQRKVQPVFVADVARAILQSLVDPAARGQTYELGGVDVWTEKEIIDLCAQHTVSDIKMFNMPDLVAKIYGSMIGGRRNTEILPTIGVITRTIFALAGKLTMPGIFHHDMVAQKYTDLTLSGQYPGLQELGVEHATPMLSEIENILLPHRKEAVERFPEAEIMKRDAKDTASF